MAAPAGHFVDQAEHPGQHDEKQERIAQLEIRTDVQRAAAERLEGGAAGPEIVQHPVAGQHDRGRARDREHAERGHERRDAGVSDDEAVDQPCDPARREPDHDRSQGGVVGFEGKPARDRREPHDRADREIDAAGRDDRGHAQRHDADEREVAGGVVEILRGGERGRLQPAHHHADDDERDRHPEGLRAGDLLPQVMLLDAQHRVDRDVGPGRRLGGVSRHRDGL